MKYQLVLRLSGSILIHSHFDFIEMINQLTVGTCNHKLLGLYYIWYGIVRCLATAHKGFIYSG